MTRAARTEYINMLREKYAPYLSQIMQTDAENGTVLMLVNQWERRARDEQDRDPMRRALIEFKRLQGTRHGHATRLLNTR